MISSICRRSTSRGTVVATDGSICSMTRSRSEADITGWWVAGSSRLGGGANRLGADDATLVSAGGKGGGAGRTVGAAAGASGTAAGIRIGISSARRPNFFIARATSSSRLFSCRRRR
ncbi:hypothetical protein [Bradyrhizobium sp. USDA 4461]